LLRNKMRIKRVFFIISKAIQFIINSILLTIVYIIGIGLTSFLAKLTGKKFLGQKRGTQSYWRDIKDDNNYYRQF